MPIPVIAILTGIGKTVKITAKAGTALYRFVKANPRITLGIVSTTALAGAIHTYARTEQEKIELLQEIFRQNPELAKELAGILFPRLPTDIFANIYSLILLLIIAMFIFKLLEK